MAITTTGFQAPATKREGLKPSVYENIILIGADETPILKLIGTSSVKGIEHSSLTDSLAAPKKNAQLEILTLTIRSNQACKRLQMRCKFSLQTLVFQEVCKQWLLTAAKS